MKSYYLFFAFLIGLHHSSSTASEAKIYSSEEQRSIYLKNRRDDYLPQSFLTVKDRAWQELNMPDLVRKIDRAKSAEGSVEFELLLQPITDIQVLEARRNLAKILLQDTHLFAELDSLVTQFDTDFASLFTHFLDENAKIEFLQESDMFSLLGDQSSLYRLSVQGLMMALITQGIAYDFWQIARNYHAVRNQQNGRLQRGWIGYNLFGQVAGAGWISYVSYNSAVSTLKKIAQADAYVLQAGKALNLIAQMHSVIKKSSKIADTAFAQAFNHYADRALKQETFVRARSSATERVASENTWLSPMAQLRSLDTYDDLRKSKQELTRALQAIGILDAYLSIARLYKDHQAQNLPVTFATYDSQSHPSFEFKGLINPIIESSIANDFSLGQNSQAHHAVLTGPNGCGKTTIMKSVAYAFIWGQSITVVPAQVAHFTPLTQVKTYFNVGDNIIKGLSSFMAEHQRMAEISQSANNLPVTARALILIDDPYVKTIQAIAEPHVTKFLRNISTKDHVLAILATHFEGPSLLEKEKNSAIKNFQPELDNNLKPTYKIIDGAAYWWFHDAERRNQFIKQLTSSDANEAP